VVDITNMLAECKTEEERQRVFEWERQSNRTIAEGERLDLIKRRVITKSGLAKRIALVYVAANVVPVLVGAVIGAGAIFFVIGFVLVLVGGTVWQVAEYRERLRTAAEAGIKLPQDDRSIPRKLWEWFLRHL
jgi:hypothetical protein